MIDLQELRETWLSGTRESCSRWILASGISWTDLSLSTGIPIRRLRTLSVNNSEILSIARVVQARRPLPFEYSLYKEAEDRYYTEAAIKTHGVLISVATTDEQRAMLEATQQRMKDAVSVINEIRLPLVEQWAEVDFVVSEDPRLRECRRCLYRWYGRSDVPPHECPRCRSPKWDDDTTDPTYRIVNCRHCGKQWRTRVASPLRCPRCQRPDWEAVDGDN